MMSKIEFSVEINPEKKEVALAAMALIAAMAELDLEDVAKPKVEVRNIKVVEPEEVKPEVENEVEKPKRKTRKTAKKTEPEVVEDETQEVDDTPVKEEKKPAKANKSTTSSQDSVSIEDIRRVLKDVVRDNREAILTKLQEFEASSASTLDEKHYGEFYKYIIGLRDE